MSMPVQMMASAANVLPEGSHFSLATAVASGTVTVVSGGVSTPRSLVFADDGTQVVLTTGSATIEARTLPTPYVAPGGTLAANSNTITLGTGGNARIWKFSPNGRKAVCWRDTAAVMESYELSTPWLLSSAVLTATSTASGMNDVFDISRDGKKLLCRVVANNTVTLRTLSTAWDVSTISAIVSSRTTDTGSLVGVAWSGDGLRFYIGDASSQQIREFSMTSAFDITSSNGTTVASLAVGTVCTVPIGIAFSVDDEIMVVSGHNLSGGKMQTYV